MTFIQLLYFAQTAETGSMRLAAQQLFVSQPSLSQAIHQLEDDLGYKLFNRTSSGVVLTPEGEEALEITRQILTLSKQLKRLDITCKDNEALHNLPSFFKIYCTSHQNGFLLGDILSIAKKDYPTVSFSVHEHFIQAVFEALNENLNSLGIFITNKHTLSNLKETFQNLEIRIFQQKQAHILVNKLSPLSSKNTVTLETLSEFPMALLFQDLPYQISDTQFCNIAFGCLVSEKIIFKSSNHILIENYLASNKDCFAVYFPDLHPLKKSPTKYEQVQ